MKENKKIGDIVTLFYSRILDHEKGSGLNSKNYSIIFVKALRGSLTLQSEHDTAAGV